MRDAATATIPSDPRDPSDCTGPRRMDFCRGLSTSSRSKGRCRRQLRGAGLGPLAIVSRRVDGTRLLDLARHELRSDSIAAPGRRAARRQHPAARPMTPFSFANAATVLTSWV